jgi:hypothetical protein
MNPLYEKAKDVILIRRTSDNKEFEEYPLTIFPISALVADPSNDIQCVALCNLNVGHAISASYVESASYAHSSSAALFAISASYANSASYTISSSYAITTSLAMEASAAYSAAYASWAVSASHADWADYAISASNAFSASYAQSASYGTNFFAPRVTSSYVSASNIIWANTFIGFKGQFTQLTASDLLVTDVSVETSSYALNALSASHAEQADGALVSAFATTAGIATTAINAFTASVATSSLSASYAFSASYAESASYGTNFYAPRVTASFVSASVNTTTHNFTASNAYIDNIVNYGQLTSSKVLAGVMSVYEVDTEYAVIQQLTASDATITGLMMGTASYANFAALASSSLGTRGLNVNNVPPMPNGDIQWTVLDSTPAVFHASTTIGSNGVTPEGSTHALVHLSENNKIYGGGWYGSFYCIEDPDGDFNNVTSASCVAGNFISQIVFASGSLYAINGSNFGPSTGSITRVNINNVASQSVIVQGLPGSATLAPLVTDGNVLLTQTNGLIYKWNLSGSLLQSTPCVSASVTVGGSHGGVASTDGKWAFFTTTGGIVTKALIADITNYTCSAHEQSNYPNCCFNASVTDDCCYLNGYLYTAVESNGNIIRMNTDDLSFVAYPAAGNSYGVFTDGTHIYFLLNSGEIWVYLNADLDSGPIRFGVAATPNELAITNGGLFVYSQWTTLNINSYYLPITQLGINKQPQYALDVAGVINSPQQIQSPTISASTLIEAPAMNVHGSITLYDPATIRSNLSGGKLLLSASIMRAPTVSASAALLGRADNHHISQSAPAGGVLTFTRSLGTIPQDGMYRLAVAGTIGLYSGSTLINQPKWSFRHTDRFATYTLPQPELTPTTLATPAGYDYAFAFGQDYVFQAVAGTIVEYYYSSAGAQMSSTDSSASFFTTTTLSQILSGSVTGST